MYHMVLMVLDDIKRAEEIYDAWSSAGVGGITIIESTGLGRVRYKQGYRDDIPLMPSIYDLLHAREEHHRVFFSVVNGEEMVDKLFLITEEIIGDLNNPNSGIMVALPITRAVGMNREIWSPDAPDKK
ncbi:MAG: hypothetical protein R6X18_08560 [Chloroflexota bacterium]|jgi:hypothetical protein